MGIKDLGYAFWPYEEGDPPLLFEIIIHEYYGSFEGKIRESVIEPTEDDIKRLADQFGFNYDEIMDLIKHKNKDTHTMMIDMPLWRDAHK